MKQLSVWDDTVSLKRHPRLEGVAGCEVLVIGGGMAGILTAHRLAAQGIDVAVADAGRIGCGNTAGTTAKITSQHGLIYQKLLQELGTEQAWLYLEANEEALKEYVSICEENNIDCNFRRVSNFIYSHRGEEILEKEMKALEQIGCQAARLRPGTSLKLPFHTDGAVEFPLQAQFHPRRFLKFLTEESRSERMVIFENTRITSLRKWQDGGWEAISALGTILADQIVVASHFPFIDRWGGYFAKMYQSRSLVIAGRGSEGFGLEGMEGMYKDEAEGGLSFREAEGLLLIGGGSGRPGKMKESWEELERKAETFCLGWETRYRWAAQDCMTLDAMPYIGPYHGFSGSQGIWTAAGFNKWGMTGSMVSAMVLTDLICGKDTPYGRLFQPNRPFLKPQLFRNAAESAVNLLSPKVPRCRHLGCALSWNEEERTWDCPCHGSRYDERGRCIEGPSTKDLF